MVWVDVLVPCSPLMVMYDDSVMHEVDCCEVDLMFLSTRQVEGNF